MIDHITKKNIRLLSERYEHTLFYYENTVIIKNEKNFIEIFPQYQEIVLVKYNYEEGSIEVKIHNSEVYDVLIKVFLRKGLEKINLNPLDPLNFNDLEEEFGDVDKFKRKIIFLINSKAGYSYIGGNRVLTEFYKGILILRDDIGVAKGNVININNDKI